jgi:alkane 1-monooxygenase
MPTRKALAFLLVFLVPALMPAAAWLGLATGRPDAMAWFPLFFLFVVLPAADYLLGHDPVNVPAALEREVALRPWFRALTLACLPVQLAVLAWSAHWFANAGFGPAGLAGWLLSQGVVGGILAINTAHELIHKDGRLEPAAGGLLLATVGYHGFKIEHLRGHHVHVSTPEDASSAPLGAWSWAFVPRALVLNSVNAWRLEAQRLRGRGLPALHWRN